MSKFRKYSPAELRHTPSAYVSVRWPDGKVTREYRSGNVLQVDVPLNGLVVGSCISVQHVELWERDIDDLG